MNEESINKYVNNNIIVKIYKFVNLKLKFNNLGFKFIIFIK